MSGWLPPCGGGSEPGPATGASTAACRTGSPTARFHIDHVRARKHGGRTAVGNLAYCCSSCNLHKGADLAGHDTRTRRVVPLFNPRVDAREVHFRRSGAALVGRTSTGRATVRVLQPNGGELSDLRASLMQEGVF